ncbi:hypothetical protein [Anaeromyxobacter terrae]|uniref:hypothetical protein n=1 Tax=Anaeromyxobacter terrae TaxID=2925406 RepID=UPI001F5718DC|nr:hypothetical protein [Anaeromyxobacter sp. SG22]
MVPTTLLLFTVALAAPADAPPAPAADPLVPILFLEGRWKGQSSGEPGKGVSVREYRLELRGRYLVGRNRSVWDPKTRDAKPEVHQDMGVFSYDKAAKKIVLRQFHVEGFVNEYVLDGTSPDGKTFTFVTVRIENIGAGWRAREVYERVSQDEVIETFSQAAPGKGFETYSVTRLTRVHQQN